MILNFSFFFEALERSNARADRREIAERLRRSEWHRWFAWRPVFVDNYRLAWLQTVERRTQFYLPWKSNIHRRAERGEQG